MSSPSTFSLLYKIETQGLDSLDGITRRQQQVNLETKYSAKELKEFESILRDATGSGQKYGRALEEISRSSTEFGRMNAKIAQDILQNDRAVQASAKETARVKAQADREAQQSANAAYQTRLRLAAEEKRALDSLIREADAGLKRKLGAEEAARAEAAAANRRLASVGASALGMGGGGLGQGFGALAGGTGGALLGVGVGAAAAAGLYGITRDTAQFAQQQQNMAIRMGGTTDQSQMFSRTSQVLGLNPEAATTAMRGLVRAIADGGEESKRGEQALKALGVSASALGNGLVSPATALEQMITKLKDIKDPIEKSRIALDLFNRTGLNLLPLVDGFDELGNKVRETGVIMDQDAIAKMAEYNREIELLGLRWDALKQSLALGIVGTIKFVFPGEGGKQTLGGGLIQSILGNIIPGATTAMGLVSGYNALKDPGAPDVSGVTGRNAPNGNFFYDQMFGQNEQRAKSLMRTVDPKAAKSRDLADAQGDLDRAYNDRMKAVTATQRQDAEARMRSAGARIAALNPEHGPNIQAELERQIRDSVAGYNARSYGSDDPVARLGVERDAKITDLRSNPRYQDPRYAGTLAEGTRQIRGAALGQILEEQRKQQEKEARAQYLLNSEIGASGTATAKQFGRGLTGDLTEMGVLGDMPGIASPGPSAKQMNEMSRIMVRGQSSIFGSTAATPTAALMQTIELRRQENDLIQQAAIAEANRFKGQQQQNELENAAQERRKADLETEIELQTRIAEIGKQQKEETRNFSEGLFGAGMSGQSSAVSNYLGGFGMSLATKAIGNASDAILPSFNSVFSLGKTGALGKDPGTPSFLGKLAKGTPFDWSAEDLKKNTDTATMALDKAKNAPLITSQELLRTSIDTLTATIGGKPPSGTSASGAVSSGGGSGIFGSLGRLLGGPGGTAPFRSSGSTGGSGGFFGGGSDFIQNGLNIPLSAMGGHSADVSAMADMVPTVNIPVAGGYSLAGTSSFGIPNGGGGGGSTSGGKLASIQSGIGQFFGGAGLALTGHGLQGIFTGKQDNGDGTGEALSGMQRVGEAAGLAGGAYAGVSGAVSGFSKGGGRGIAKGIGSTMGTAALFDPEPISKAILGAGAAISGIVSSLMGDPVAQKQKQIDETLTNQQYVEPNQHNYSYSAGGGGVDFGADGSMRSGAKEAGYTVNVHAMDAASMYSTIQRNSQAFGSNLSQSLGSSGVGALASEVSWHALHP